MKGSASNWILHPATFNVAVINKRVSLRLQEQWSLIWNWHPLLLLQILVGILSLNVDETLSTSPTLFHYREGIKTSEFCIMKSSFSFFFILEWRTKYKSTPLWRPAHGPCREEYVTMNDNLAINKTTCLPSVNLRHMSHDGFRSSMTSAFTVLQLWHCRQKLSSRNTFSFGV